MMKDENKDTHRRAYTEEKKWVAKWMTNEDADKKEEEE
jgi:hypothetical protein